MVSRSEHLRMKLRSMEAFWVQNGSSAVEAKEMEAMRAELRKLARRRAAARVRREILYDINGHHGPA